MTSPWDKDKNRASSSIDEVYKKINEINPILQTMDESLLKEIWTIKDSVERLLENRERIERLFSKETLTADECKFAQETVMSLMQILTNQRTFSADTIKTLEKERTSVQSIKTDFAKLKEEAYIDTFTWLFNKFKFTEIYQELIREFNGPNKHNFSIVCVEINDLIEIRDSFWEEIYDDLIKLFSYFLWKKLWKIWMVFHFHWNEFIFLTKINSKDLIKIVKRMSEDFSKMKSLEDIWTIFWQERKWYLWAQVDSLQGSLSLLLDVYSVSVNFSGRLLDYNNSFTEETFLSAIREKCYLAKNEWKWVILA